VLGVFGDPGVTGKPAGDDLREGKRTALVALARERATPAERERLDRGLGDPALDEAGTAELRAIITGTGALAACERMIESSVGEALRTLADAPMTAEAKLALTDLAVVVTDRNG
jgi:geranylgeranyl diphosphate synthase type I